MRFLLVELQEQRIRLLQVQLKRILWARKQKSSFTRSGLVLQGRLLLLRGLLKQQQLPFANKIHGCSHHALHALCLSERLVVLLRQFHLLSIKAIQISTSRDLYQ